MEDGFDDHVEIIWVLCGVRGSVRFWK